MSHKNIEIEAKFKVKNIKLLKDWLKKNGRLVSHNQVVDIYFTPIHRDFLKCQYPFEWLRLRSEEGKFFVNYKHWYPENTAKSTHCDEFETFIGSLEQLEKIFQALNFKKIATVDKYRENYKVGVFQFSVDRVKDLGDFLEIEYYGRGDNIEKVNKKMEEFYQCLSQCLDERNYRGYPYLILEKNGLLPKLSK